MKVVLLCMVILTAQAHDGGRIVNTKQGPVKGYKVPDYDVIAYYSIPYATAPKGRDRFKAPLPPPTWTEPYEAVTVDIRCPQHGLDPEMYTEDCLVVSVFVPDVDPVGLPVLYAVHGGGFQLGYGNDDSFNQLINYKKNVIVVTVNYRVGPHGFLCLGTPDVPGNAAMKDQVAGLKWVQENIAGFGGNPDDVTIVGCSAGGASVDFLQLSKTTVGLFNKVISQSGVAISAFGAQVDPTENARNYAKELNYDGPDNLSALEEFYRNITFERLHSIDLGYIKDVAVVFSPCVERDIGIERFLHDTPMNIIKTGDYIRYPTVYGLSNMEGLYRLNNFPEWSTQMDEDFTPFLPADLGFESPEQKQEIANGLKELYFGNDPVEDNLKGFIYYNSDAMFNVAIQKAVSMQVEAGNDNVYLYVYSYLDNNTVPFMDNEKGASHCTQYIAVLDENENSLALEDVEMKRTVRDLWLNFVYTGEPTPEGKTPSVVPKWNPAGANRTPCMNLGVRNEVLPGPYMERTQEFWDDIYDRFKREPVAPYHF